MGWTSGSDTFGTQAAAHTKFSTAEAAVRYCDKHGMEYRIDEASLEPDPPKEPKVYADNFLWDGDEVPPLPFQLSEDYAGTT